MMMMKKKKKKAKRMHSNHQHSRRDWSNLPVIAAIADLLPVVDRIRCRSICSSWCSAISPVRLPSLPWFLIPYNNEYDESFTTLFSPCTKDQFTLTLPNKLPTGSTMVGSKDGYIAACNQLLNIHLFSPFSSTSTPTMLPSLSTLPRTMEPFHETNTDGSVYLWGFRIFEGYRYPLSKCNLTMAGKIVFSTPDPESDEFFALSNLKVRELIYIKAGDKAWRYVLDRRLRNEAIVDIIFHDDKFYILTERCQVMACDFSCPLFPRVTTVAEVDELELPDEIVNNNADKYLAFSKTGDMLMVFREGSFLCLPDDRKRFVTRTCLVMKFDHRKISVNRGWEVLDDLGEQSLFLGDNNAIVVSAADAPGIRNNCIYFTDVYSPEKLHCPSQRWEDVVRDVGFFDMKKKTFEQFHPSQCTLHKPAPIWFNSKMPSN